VLLARRVPRTVLALLRTLLAFPVLLVPLLMRMVKRTALLAPEARTLAPLVPHLVTSALLVRRAPPSLLALMKPLLANTAVTAPSAIMLAKVLAPLALKALRAMIRLAWTSALTFPFASLVLLAFLPLVPPAAVTARLANTSSLPLRVVASAPLVPLVIPASILRTVLAWTLLAWTARMAPTAHRKDRMHALSALLVTRALVSRSLSVTRRQTLAKLAVLVPSPPRALPTAPLALRAITA